MLGPLEVWRSDLGEILDEPLVGALFVDRCLCIVQCAGNGFFVLLTLIVPANYFQASVKCREAQKCLYLTLSIQCHMQLKLLMSLTAV